MRHREAADPTGHARHRQRRGRRDRVGGSRHRRGQDRRRGRGAARLRARSHHRRHGPYRAAGARQHAHASVDDAHAQLRRRPRVLAVVARAHQAARRSSRRRRRAYRRAARSRRAHPRRHDVLSRHVFFHGRRRGRGRAQRHARASLRCAVRQLGAGRSVARSRRGPARAVARRRGGPRHGRPRSALAVSLQPAVSARDPAGSGAASVRMAHPRGRDRARGCARAARRTRA